MRTLPGRAAARIVGLTSLSTFALVGFANFGILGRLMWWFDSPMGIFEVTFAAWLLLKALKPLGIADTRGAEA